MSYGPTITARAFSLYVLGNNAEKIAEILQSEKVAPRITSNTIRKWENQKDKHGETWKDRRQAIELQVRKNIERESASKIAEMRQKTHTIMQSLYSKLTAENAPHVKSYEGAVYALKAMMDFELKLDQKASGQSHPLKLAQLMLEIFQGVPEISHAIRKNWPKVSEEIRLKLIDNQVEGDEWNE